MFFDNHSFAFEVRKSFYFCSEKSEEIKDGSLIEHCIDGHFNDATGYPFPAFWIINLDTFAKLMK